MKKIVIFSAIILLVFCFGLTKVLANSSVEKSLNIISVQGTAESVYAPDILYITLGVETFGKTASASSSSNSEKINKVINSLSPLINKEQGDIIKTVNFNVYAQYDYDNQSKSNYLVGYRTNNEIMIRTKNINNSGKIIDTAVQNGANQVRNIRFAIENNSACEKELLKQAINDAKITANVIAKELGKNIIGVKQVSQVSASPAITNYNAVGLKMSRESVSTPIEQGDIKLQSQVFAEFIID